MNRVFELMIFSVVQAILQYTLTAKMGGVYIAVSFLRQAPDYFTNMFFFQALLSGIYHALFSRSLFQQVPRVGVVCLGYEVELSRLHHPIHTSRHRVCLILAELSSLHFHKSCSTATIVAQ